MKFHESLARSLIEHEIVTMFGVIGDANLFMVDSFARLGGTRYVSETHENSAVIMAYGFGSISGQLGCATITQGAVPNISSALSEAARARRPLLVIIGDTDDPANVRNLDQAAYVAPTGAGFETVKSAACAGEAPIAQRRGPALNPGLSCSTYPHTSCGTTSTTHPVPIQRN